MQTIILATHNAGKIREFQTLLAPIECVSQQDIKHLEPIEETGLSFIENALLKARHASHFHQSQAALADDSGLVVPALQGQPGIYSARYAKENASDKENIEFLLEKMKGIPDRRAFFYCALVLIKHANDPTPLIATGTLHGLIAEKPSGTEGFGYDPIFYLPQYQGTLAEISLLDKNKISHRAKALQYLQKQLNAPEDYL